MSALGRVGFAIGIIFLGGATGFLAARLFAPKREAALISPDAPKARTLGSSGGAPPNLGPEEPPQRRPVPSTLPAISLPDFSGVRRSLSDWKGRPLIVNFWATWCDPCRREIPLLVRIRREHHAADGLEIIGIAVDSPDAVHQFAGKLGIDYPVLIGEQEGLDAVASFGMDAVFPFSVFAARDGRIVTLKVGELHADETRYIVDRVKDVDDGRMDLATARQRISGEVAALAARRAKEDMAGTQEEPASPALSPTPVR